MADVRASVSSTSSAWVPYPIPQLEIPFFLIAFLAQLHLKAHNSGSIRSHGWKDRGTKVLACANVLRSLHGVNWELHEALVR